MPGGSQHQESPLLVKPLKTFNRSARFKSFQLFRRVRSPLESLNKDVPRGDEKETANFSG